MRVALKEWAVVCEALAAGRQIFLLRKGGIAEGKRGFELLHDRFVFFPTWEHQQRDWVRAENRTLFDALEPSDPDRIEVRHGAQVDEVLPAPADIGRLVDAGALHIWEEPYLRMRYNYRPDLPLYLVLVRAFTLAAPQTIANDRRYKGCRSWVDLYEDVDAEGAANAVSDARFEAEKRRLLAAIR